MELKDYIKETLENIKEQEGQGSHPGLQSTKNVQKKEKDTNTEYYDEVKKKMRDYSTYDNGEEDSDEDYVLQDPPKFEPSDDEQEYIEDIERSRGLQHYELDHEPTDGYKKRAQAAIEGDTTMGNKTYTGEENGNTEPVWGASSEDFGEKLVKQANRRKERTDKARENLTSFGDDVEVSDKEKMNRTNAFGESKNKDNKGAIKENKNNNKMSNKMTRLKFKKKFNGMDNALSLIPEHHKVDGNKLELTDGNETYRVRWEIDESMSNEGKPIILESKNNENLQEEDKRVKELMNFKPDQQFGNLKGEQRLQENEEFQNIWEKSKKIMTENNEAEDEEKIQTLKEVDGKLKKKHFPKFAKKPLTEVARSMANKRLSKYNTKFNDITEAFDLKSRVKEGMTYDQINYVIEEGIKEASRLSLIKEDVRADEAYDIDSGEETAEKVGNELAGAGKDIDEQEGGYDPSSAAGAGAERVVNWVVKTLKKVTDPEKALKVLNKVEEKLGELGTGAGSATGTGTSGVKREGEITEDELNETLKEQFGGHDPSSGAGAGAERVVSAIANAFKKLGDEETIKNAIAQAKEQFQNMAKGAGGATGTGTKGVPRESYEPSSEKKSLIDEDYYDEGGDEDYYGDEGIENLVDYEDFLEDVVFSKLPEMEQSPSEFYVVDFPNVESPKEMMQDMEEYGPYKSSREAEEVRDELIDGEIGRINNVRVISGKQMEALSRMASDIAGVNE